MNKETTIKYNGDTYIVKSQYDYDLYELRLNKDKEIERLNKEKDDLDDYNRHLHTELTKLQENARGQVNDYFKDKYTDEVLKNAKLTKENENLKDYLKIMEKGKDNNLNRFLDYKSRNEKAINILELSSQNKGMCTRPETDTIQSALIILKGEKDD